MTPAIDAEIEARIARGESAQTIHAALGVLSVATIDRRKRELRGKAPAPKGDVRSKAKAPMQPVAEMSDDVPDAVPEGASIEQVDGWIRKLEDAAEVAESQGNLTALASIYGKIGTMSALRARLVPLPKQDPADNPDFQALAAQGRERLAKLARALFATDQ